MAAHAAMNAQTSVAASGLIDASERERERH
jgi:hypothetical protein